MQITFRSTLSTGRIVNLVLGVLALLFALPCLVGLVAAVVIGTAAGRDLRLVAPAILIVTGVVWLGWIALPPLRTHLLVFTASGVTLRGYGSTLSIPWPDVELMRVDMLPVRRKIPGNGPAQAWHLVVVPRDQEPVEVPLDTFDTTVDGIVAAFRQTAPDTVTLELADDVAHLAEDAG
ncbi:MAG: hypothetical protein ACRDTM_08475 [Micromonosporaceae bacterium]